MSSSRHSFRVTKIPSFVIETELYEEPAFIWKDGKILPLPPPCASLDEAFKTDEDTQARATELKNARQDDLQKLTGPRILTLLSLILINNTGKLKILQNFKQLMTRNLPTFLPVWHYLVVITLLVQHPRLIHDRKINA